MSAIIVLEKFALWFVFFATTVYGHVALKIAVSSGESLHGFRQALWEICSPLGISALLAWSVSGVIWALILSEQSLSNANSISAIRYCLIGAAAWIVLHERMTGTQVVGAILIVAGVYLTLTPGVSN